MLQDLRALLSTSTPFQEGSQLWAKVHGLIEGQMSALQDAAQYQALLDSVLSEVLVHSPQHHPAEVWSLVSYLLSRGARINELASLASVASTLDAKVMGVLLKQGVSLQLKASLHSPGFLNQNLHNLIERNFIQEFRIDNRIYGAIKFLVQLGAQISSCSDMLIMALSQKLNHYTKTFTQKDLRERSMKSASTCVQFIELLVIHCGLRLDRASDDIMDLILCFLLQNKKINSLRYLLDMGINFNRLLNPDCWVLFPSGVGAGCRPTLLAVMLRSGPEAYELALHALRTKQIDVNMADAFGRTEAVLAAQAGNVAMLQHLKELGADLTVKTKIQRTLLHEAVLGGHSECVRWLLGQGMPCLPDEDNETPQDIAFFKQDHACQQVFAEFAEREQRAQAAFTAYPLAMWNASVLAPDTRLLGKHKMSIDALLAPLSNEAASATDDAVVPSLKRVHT